MTGVTRQDVNGKGCFEMQYTTSVTIDWISYTLPVGQGITWALEAPLLYPYLCDQAIGRHLTWKPEIPLHGYTDRFVAVDIPGVSVMFSPAREDMGIHVVMSGSALRRISGEEALQYAAYANGRITRLDVALDVGVSFDFRGLYDACRAGLLDTKARKCSVIDSDSGTTVYIGSRASESMLRVYDKAAEANLPSALTRLELEIKGQKANAVAQYLIKHGLANIPAIIRAFCDWPTDKKWQQIFESVPKLGLSKPEKTTDREKWIREQLRSALTRAMREDSPEVKELVALLYWQATAEQRAEIQLKWRALDDEIPF